MRLPGIEKLHLADLSLPEGHPLAGQACLVNAFVIRHPEGLVLVDTGVGEGHPGIEQLYRPVRRPLTDALAAVGLSPADIAVVINTHLHFDHCGENRLFPKTPVYVQQKEHEAAREPLYTITEWVDAAHVAYELLQGEEEVLAGLWIVPTSGHTPGHQSVLIESDEGRIVIAGQAVYSAEEFAAAEDENAAGAEGAWDAAAYESSRGRLRELKPLRVYFSHDDTVWEQPNSKC